MPSLTPNTKADASPKPHIEKSAAEITLEAMKSFHSESSVNILDGLRKLHRQRYPEKYTLTDPGPKPKARP